jgi:hypothetical protein
MKNIRVSNKQAVATANNVAGARHASDVTPIDGHVEQPSIDATAAIAEYAANLASAVELYISRRTGLSDPSGHYANGAKWYPSDPERCWCCKYIREPSWRWPQSLEKHCRSFEHIASLKDVDATDLRRAVRSLKVAQGSAK